MLILSCEEGHPLGDKNCVASSLVPASIRPVRKLSSFKNITFWEGAAHSVYSMFSLYFDIVILVIFHFGFEGGTLVLIASISSHVLFVF